VRAKRSPDAAASPKLTINLIELPGLSQRPGRGPGRHLSGDRPVFGYGRAERRQGRREAHHARVGRDLEVGGIDHVVTVAPHTAKIEGSSVLRWIADGSADAACIGEAV